MTNQYSQRQVAKVSIEQLVQTVKEAVAKFEEDTSQIDQPCLLLENMGVPLQTLKSITNISIEGTSERVLYWEEWEQWKSLLDELGLVIHEAMMQLFERSKYTGTVDEKLMSEIVIVQRQISFIPPGANRLIFISDVIKYMRSLIVKHQAKFYTERVNAMYPDDDDQIPKVVGTPAFEPFTGRREN